MRNYCIINGVNSNTISGLLIQELPSVQKPKMRTRTETIDGRDGDIVTNLGYEAYDRDMSIGLYGSFDIDRISEFFAQSGTVTFSNEPTKAYKFEVFDEIDYERLGRFREAKITFHVQPYKTPINEAPIDKEFEDGEGGTIRIWNDGNIYSRPQITIYGSGDMAVYLNGSQFFEISLSNDYEYITIDTGEQNSYCGGVLLNRSVTGDYSQFVLPKGASELTVEGAVDRVIISNYVRWI